MTTRYLEVDVTVRVRVDAEKIAPTKNVRKGTDRRYMDSSAVERATIVKVGGDYPALTDRGFTLDLGVGFQKTQVVFLEAVQKEAPKPQPAATEAFDLLNAPPAEGFNLDTEVSPRDKFLALCRAKNWVGGGGLPDAILKAVKDAQGVMDDKALHTAINGKLQAMGLPKMSATDYNVLKSAAK